MIYSTLSFFHYSLVDSLRTDKYDNLLRFYGEILHKWGLYNQRIEMLEFVHKKDTHNDFKYGRNKHYYSKFEFLNFKVEST